ncbi:MAG: tRNA pseudouridine(38-40) synthase TruA [Anaerorhabdus sp.]
MRYFVKVSYDGTNYAGWQSQPNKVTVQSQIELALKKITKENIMIHGSGRTDARVHALNQVFHFDTELFIDEAGWTRAFNSHLPKDIVVKCTKRVSDDAHCRRDAKKKYYQYLINTGKYNLFDRNTIYQYNKKLDLDKMIEASSIFIGVHDFSSFCANTKEEKENQIREIFEINFTVEKDIISVMFVGNGFLRYMVRMLMGALIDVGRGKITTDELKAIFNKKDKDACNCNADPCGLYLVKVCY